MNTHVLSKSSYLKGLQCEKHLYLYKNHPEWMDKLTDLQKAIFSKGTDVGKLAQNLFPGGVDASPQSFTDYSESIEATKLYISQKQNVIYEAAFQSDDVLAACDVLISDKKKWKVVEVKSSTSITEVHIDDAAIQYYVLNGCGIDIADFSIAYINNQYVRKGEIDLEQLFKIESVINLIIPMQQLVKKNINRLKDVLLQPGIPNIDIGEHCTYPYQCSFMGHCWKHIPGNSIFDISNMHLRKKFELYKQGIVKIDDIPVHYNLSKNQRLQVDAFKSGADYINHEGIKQFLSTISYPLYFMDFETFQPAVPLFDNSKPYQQIPFQYSLHYKSKPDGILKHYEFLADAGTDPRIDFIEGLLEHTKGDGTILVYNKAFEISRLKEIANDFTEYAEEIGERISHIIDLIVPFQRKYYYTPQMKGLYSIKFVLPALVPELSYTGMEISEGAMASLTYESLFSEQDMFKIADIKNHLLEYCRLDTLGMVKILEHLELLVS